MHVHVLRLRGLSPQSHGVGVARYIRVVTSQVIALSLTVVVHFVGAAVLVIHMLGDQKIDWRGLLGGGSDGGGGSDSPPPESPRDPGGSALPLPLPLPDASPSAVRLREPGRLADLTQPPQRRPEHPPARPRPRVPGA
jgi:hypothetical protein